MGSDTSKLYKDDADSQAMCRRVRHVLLASGPDRLVLLDEESTKEMASHLKSLKFAQEVLAVGPEGQVGGATLASVLYHSNALGICDIKVGDTLRPFNYHGLRYPRLPHPRPTTQSVTQGVGWDAIIQSDDVAVVDATWFLKACPLTGGPTSGGTLPHIQYPMDAYLQQIKRVATLLESGYGADAALNTPTTQRAPLAIQTKDLDGALDKIVYRGKTGSDFCRCRVPPTDYSYLKSYLLERGLTLMEEATTKSGVVAAKFAANVLLRAGPVPFWLEVQHTSDHDDDEAEHTRYEVLRLQRGIDMQLLEQAEAFTVAFVSVKGAQEKHFGAAQRQEDFQMAMLASKYGAQ